MSSPDLLPTVTSPVPRTVWASLFRSDAGAVVSQSLAWRDAVFASGRYRDVSLLYEFPSGQQVVLPMAQQRQRPAWAAMAASWPRDWGIGGPICQGGSIGAVEADAVLADLARRRTLATQIQLRPRISGAWLASAGTFQISQFGRCCHLLDLAEGSGRVWRDRFRGTARTAIRKAERADLDVEVDRSGRLLPEFMYLYEKSLGRWAAMQHEPAWLTRWRAVRSTSPGVLSSVAKHFGPGCAIWVARSEGQPVAAIIVLSCGRSTKYWRGAMDKDLAGPRRANELLHWRAIEEACHGGYRFYDMGLTRPASPLAAFKEKLGAVPHVTHALRAERLPVHDAERLSRNLVKRVIGFQDV
jgi:hypothetical protein